MDFRPVSEESPGRLNVFRNGARVAIVDFAHNEAGLRALLDVADGIAAGAGGPVTPITVIIGTAGDRPDDSLRGMGAIAAARAQRVAIKETLGYLRGRSQGLGHRRAPGGRDGRRLDRRHPGLRVGNRRTPGRAERSGGRGRRLAPLRPADRGPPLPRGPLRGVRAPRRARLPARPVRGRPDQPGPKLEERPRR